MFPGFVECDPLINIRDGIRGDLFDYCLCFFRGDVRCQVATAYYRLLSVEVKVGLSLIKFQWSTNRTKLLGSKLSCSAVE